MRRQAIIWSNAEILLIGPLGTNFSEISIEIYIFLFKKWLFKMSSAKCRPFCLGINVLDPFLEIVFQYVKVHVQTVTGILYKLLVINRIAR